MTFLNYIQLTGSQYVDIGLDVSASDFTVEISYMPKSLSTMTGIFQGTWSLTGYVLATQQGYIRYHSKGAYIDISGVSISNYNIIKTTPTDITVNGTVHTLSGATSVNTSTTLILFKGESPASVSNASGKLQYLKVWSGGSLVRNLMPIISDANRVGLYDTITGTIYYSESGTDFVAGSALPKSQELVNFLKTDYHYTTVSFSIDPSKISVGNVDLENVNVVGLYSTANRSTSPYFCVQVGSLSLSNGTTDLTWPTPAGYLSKKEIINSNEDFTKLFRNSSSGSLKWLVRYESIKIKPQYVNYGLVYFATTIDCTEYNVWSLYTANDGDERDPISFGLVLGNYNPSTQELVLSIFDYGENRTITTSRNALAYNNQFYITSTLYRYIRMNITAIRGGGTGIISMSQIEMRDSNDNRYDYPSGTTISTTNVGTVYDGSKDNLIIPFQGNARICFNATSYPVRFTIDLQSAVFNPLMYNKWAWYLSSEQAYPDRDPLDFSLEISEDGTNWIEVDSVTGATLVPLSSRPAAGYVGNISVTPPTPVPSTTFRYIRLDILKKRASDSYIQLSDVRFKTSAGVFFTWPSSTICTSTTSPTSSGENASKLIDGNTSTKFCTPANTTSITFDMGSNKYVDISEYTQWCWYTANDGPNRDPVSFTLYGSQDGTNWVELDSAVDASITTTRKALAYTGNLSVPVPSYTVRFNSNMPPNNLWNGEIYDGYYCWNGSQVKITAQAGNKYAMVPVIPGHTYILTINGDNTKITRCRIKMMGSGSTMPMSNTTNAVRSIDGNDSPTFPRTYTITAASNEYYIMIYGSPSSIKDTSWTVECYDTTSYTQVIEVDVPTALIPNTFTSPVKNMIGWSTSPTGGVDYEDEEVVTNLGNEGETIDLYAVWEISAGYLLGDGSGKIYTLVNGSVSEISGATENSLTKAFFQANSFREELTGDILTSLINPKVYSWGLKEAFEMSASVKATPFPQELTGGVFDLADPTILGIDTIEAEYSGDVGIKYSVNNSTWSSEYTMSDFLNMGTTLWNNLTQEKKIYVIILLNDETSSFTKLKINCVNE